MGLPVPAEVGMRIKERGDLLSRVYAMHTGEVVIPDEGRNPRRNVNGY